MGLLKQAKRNIALGMTRLLLVLLRLFSTLPLPIISQAGNATGLLAYCLAAKRRRIARINLTLCMPALSKAAREKMVRQHFCFYGRSFFERFIIWHGSKARIERIVHIEGLEHLRESLGKPIIILAPHFLGLDAGGIRVSIEQRVVSMYAIQSNPVLNKATLDGRTRFNDCVLLSRQDGLLQAVRLIKNGLPLYFLPDMDLGPRDAVFADFFGVSAATVTSVSRLAKLTGAMIIPCVTHMHSKGYTVRFYPRWTDYPVNDPQAAAKHMNHFIEQRVLEMPAQYLWTHKRFKTRPLGEASFYAK